MSTECYSPSGGRAKEYCPLTKKAGKPVSETTIRSLVHATALKGTDASEAFYFCDDTGCDVVYFSASGSLLRRSDVRVPVHHKDSSLDVPVCYCFGFTPRKIFEEIDRTCQSSVVSGISQKVKEGLCFCESSNPQGACCLANIGKVVKEGVARFIQRAERRCRP